MSLNFLDCITKVEKKTMGLLQEQVALYYHFHLERVFIGVLSKAVVNIHIKELC